MLLLAFVAIVVLPLRCVRETGFVSAEQQVITVCARGILERQTDSHWLGGLDGNLEKVPDKISEVNGQAGA